MNEYMKVFKHVLIFDKYSIKNEIINDTDSIIDKLIDSPVMNVNNPDTVIGFITNVEHRKNDLFFGDIYIFKDSTFDKIQVTKTDLVYNNISENSINVTGFITYIKTVDNENKS